MEQGSLRIFPITEGKGQNDYSCGCVKTKNQKHTLDKKDDNTIRNRDYETLKCIRNLIIKEGVTWPDNPGKLDFWV